MPIDRTLILKGPAKITFDSAAIFSEADIVVNWITDYFDVPTSAFGNVGRRVGARRIEVDLIPKMWSDLTKILPYASKQIGATIYDGTDKPLVITPSNGAPLTVTNVAITQQPNLTFSVNKPLLRPMRFTGLCANNSDPAVEANWYSFGTPATNVALTGFDLTKVLNTRYSLGWNSATYQSEQGFNLDFNLGLVPDVVDGEGIVNYRITELDASLKFVPTGKTEANFASLLGWGVALGAQPTLSNAVVTGVGTGNPVFTLVNAQVMQGSTAYGAAANRFGEVELMSVRKVTSGALDALWTVAAAA